MLCVLFAARIHEVGGVFILSSRNLADDGDGSEEAFKNDSFGGGVWPAGIVCEGAWRPAREPVRAAREV